MCRRYHRARHDGYGRAELVARAKPESDNSASCVVILEWQSKYAHGAEKVRAAKQSECVGLRRLGRAEEVETRGRETVNVL